MIAVIFELTPAPGRKQEYLDLAAALKPELERTDGFISIERFESLSNPGHFVSLSFWRDEEAVRRWRNLAGHREIGNLYATLTHAVGDPRPYFGLHDPNLKANAWADGPLTEWLA